ncbi:MAG: hypothetical protein LBR25_08290 [Erysipelotrichaceae bacterium]|jgi:hypothetical protein|nr:hypothetical protein [Erysipelotrichaceae bacterium]
MTKYQFDTVAEPQFICSSCNEFVPCTTLKEDSVVVRKVGLCEDCFRSMKKVTNRSLLFSVFIFVLMSGFFVWFAFSGFVLTRQAMLGFLFFIALDALLCGSLFAGGVTDLFDNDKAAAIVYPVLMVFGVFIWPLVLIGLLVYRKQLTYQVLRHRALAKMAKEAAKKSV